MGNAEFEVTNLRVSQDKVEQGKTTTVFRKATNTKEREGTYTANLSIDGEFKTQSIILKPDESEKVTFEISREEGLAPTKSKQRTAAP